MFKVCDLGQDQLKKNTTMGRKDVEIVRWGKRGEEGRERGRGGGGGGGKWCCLEGWRKVVNASYMPIYQGSRPDWCISSMIYSRDTPFWSGTLESE